MEKYLTEVSGIALGRRLRSCLRNRWQVLFSYGPTENGK